ncbi:MAG TPA: hypothetical protein VIF09_20895 [Polyangiaceae bacterium]|jgi:hypothetical protein
MPWKIVNLDFAGERPHLHIKDPGNPIHLRSYFVEKQVEIGLGAEEPDGCFVRATVSPDAVVVEAIRFEPLHVQILSTILASLDVEPHERDAALAWMKERLSRRAFDPDGWLPGNVTSFPAPTGWPYDLTEEALVDSLRDPSAMPSTRRKALLREASRRGTRVR